MLVNHCDDCIFYIDESGDLGFGSGGSQYFVIAVVCVDRGNQVQLKRFVRKFRIEQKLPTKVELKAATTKLGRRNDFCHRLTGLDCSAHYLVVNKSRVKPELRKDTNILYNYLTGMLLTPLMSPLREACIHLDNRTIKVASGNSLHDYLRIKLWFEMNSVVNVKFAYLDSRECLGIQTADFVANAVYRNYENSDVEGYNKLMEIFGEKKKLFF